MAAEPPSREGASVSQHRKTPDPPRDDRRTLMVLALLAAASTAWAGFLWRQLIVSRSGGEPFCAFGVSDCARLWDGAFATWVHHASGLPVAGWGVAWSAVATVLALAAWLGLEHLGPLRAPRAAIRVTALVGILTTGLLLAVSALEGTFCSNCAITYVLAFAYGAVAFFGVRAPKKAGLEPGLWSAGALALAAYAVLLYPGLKTPRNRADAGRAAVAQAAESLRRAPLAQGAGGAQAGPDGTVPSSSAGATGALPAFLADLPEDLRQALSTTLAMYRSAPSRPTDPPRAPLGNARAPVVITEFVDTLCSHCADLHGVMRYLLESVPEQFALDARHFPLDGHCNPRLPIRGAETVRCLAARVQICAENAPRRFELAGELFENQEHLDTDAVLEIASRYLDQMSLDACLTDPRTEQKLLDDIAFAGRFNPTGTPLVLVNGRQASAFGPFLLAMILANGDAEQPAFDTLPPPGSLPRPASHRR